MRSGHTAGAALDVYPSEPAANGDYFNDALNSWGNDLRSLKNLILTPHIGGSTEGRLSYIMLLKIIEVNILSQRLRVQLVLRLERLSYGISTLEALLVSHYSMHYEYGINTF